MPQTDNKYLAILGIISVFLCLLLICVMINLLTCKCETCLSGMSNEWYHGNHLTSKLLRPVDANKSKIDSFNPESRVMSYHSAGDDLMEIISVKKEMLTTDQLSTNSTETDMDKVTRDLANNYDAPQLEGMYAPIDEFEKTAFTMQNKKNASIYGDDEY